MVGTCDSKFLIATLFIYSFIIIAAAAAIIIFIFIYFIFELVTWLEPQP